MLVFLSAVFVLSNSASADPDGDDYETVLCGVWFLMNLPPCLFFFGISIYIVCRIWPVLAEKRMPTVPSWFMARFPVAALVTTTVVAFIDLVVLFDSTDDIDLSMWSIGAVLVLISVYLASLILMRLDPVMSFVPAALTALACPLLWWSQIALENESATFAFVLLPLAFLLLCAIVVWLLHQWHESTFIEQHAYPDSD